MGGRRFACGEDRLIAMDESRALRWDIRPAAWARHACQVAGRRLTRAEWASTSPPGRTRPPAECQVVTSLWCMDTVADFFERFNAGDLDGIRDLMAPGYSYAEPMFPELRDAEAHVELMKQVAQARPDRRIEVGRRLPGADGAAVEATWSGTPAEGGDTLRLACVFVFDLDAAGQITRLRGYYAAPH
jgi:ketosteroid isomerase-like protein